MSIFIPLTSHTIPLTIECYIGNSAMPRYKFHTPKFTLEILILSNSRENVMTYIGLMYLHGLISGCK